MLQLRSHTVGPVNITRVGQKLLIVLPESDAKILMQTCALVVTAVNVHPELTLPPEMQSVLCQLFSGLKNCSSTRTKESQG